eukprot:GILK01008385.1.p1 GENE.GILK01008385.1~~GILK01008385.1.p1  ORF type:complete len:568 (-),score=67.16 GILK01008385.1:148-1617(-)
MEKDNRVTQRATRALQEDATETRQITGLVDKLKKPVDDVSLTAPDAYMKRKPNGRHNQLSLPARPTTPKVLPRTPSNMELNPFLGRLTLFDDPVLKTQLAHRGVANLPPESCSSPHDSETVCETCLRRALSQSKRCVLSQEQREALFKRAQDSFVSSIHPNKGHTNTRKGRQGRVHISQDPMTPSSPSKTGVLASEEAEGYFQASLQLFRVWDQIRRGKFPDVIITMFLKSRVHVSPSQLSPLELRRLFFWLRDKRKRKSQRIFLEPRKRHQAGFSNSESDLDSFLDSTLDPQYAPMWDQLGQQTDSKPSDRPVTPSESRMRSLQRGKSLNFSSRAASPSNLVQYDSTLSWDESRFTARPRSCPPGSRSYSSTGPSMESDSVQRLREALLQHLRNEETKPPTLVHLEKLVTQHHEAQRLGLNKSTATSVHQDSVSVSIQALQSTPSSPSEQRSTRVDSDVSRCSRRRPFVDGRALLQWANDKRNASAAS